MIPEYVIAGLWGLLSGSGLLVGAVTSVFAASDLTRLRDALERGGAVFIREDNSGGLGVRLKFNAKDVRAINRMEGEGGPVGTDDV